ncbi:CDP-diacylglycerol--glycerol-3-phosphate 3-phosphatidyltransferase [Kineococcus radiotolerans]|uniref:Phosphatidylinositol phosphate synthase n=1 Tax=Kineococcus radiotolerans TaxID=131568 RepID=A0A7W4TPM2_KINRA|nr:CDP-alcohol phosphatidyltransferase family protein [Kineococcus radiotolerans]MBB2902798.1 CDP-diacylglycerol--glycerol-3-phosphate 3-phosphatidyltransferase [Kineococcus radiotolerans]
MVTRIFTPLARLLLRLGLTPDVVTVTGTLGVVVSALVLYPMGQLFWGSLAVAVFVLSDMLDGIMARTTGRSGSWGAYLDSTLDRFGDSAVFAGLVVWFVRDGDSDLTAGLALACLVLGSIVSYAKARAEGLGYTANVGIAERSDRLVAVLVGAALVGLGVPLPFLQVVLGLLAAASLVTVVQRMAAVHRQALAPAADA